MQGGGFRILARNVRIAGIEIDIVATRKRELWVVEVKTTRGATDPESSLTASQRQRLFDACRRLPAPHFVRKPRVELRLAAVHVSADETVAIRFFSLSAGGVAEIQ